jgi:eukaryotic-like serine/threonine-protein kinase
MGAPRQFAVLGPLMSGSENRAFLGCEVIEGVPHPDLPVVVVWLPDNVTKDPKQVARLQRETSFVTQLKHPNIIRVYGLECFEEGWARVVAFVDGEPLHHILHRARSTERPIEPLVAARIAIDTCEGVNHAHEEGQSRYAGRPIVHGGIRTDTLLITFHGVTMVTGYGASVLAPPQDKNAPEKFAYLAPEQIIGGKATASPATDVYAIGALLYELLAGHPPFHGAPDIERAVLTSEPPRIEDDGVRGRLGSVAATALAKRGSDRFESVAQLKDAIVTALADDRSASREDVAMLVNELIPASNADRQGRASLLAAARDPDSVTILSRPSQAPEGVDQVLFEASRVGPQTRQTAFEDPAEQLREPRPREENTIVDGRVPEGFRSEPQRDEVTQEEYASDLELGARGQNGSGHREPPLVIPAADLHDEQTEAHIKAPTPSTLPQMPPPQMPPPQMMPTPRPAQSGVAAFAGSAQSQSRAPHPQYAPVISGPPANGNHPRPQQPPSPQPPTGPQQFAGYSQPPRPAQAAPMNYLAQAAAEAQASRSSAPAMANALRGPAAVPRAPMRETSAITNFDRKVGDSSRSIMIAVLIGAAVLLGGIFYFAQPPPEIREEAQLETHHALPKDLVKAVLTQPKDKKPGEEVAEKPEESPPPEEPNAANAAAPAENDELAGGEAAPKDAFGKLTLNTDPDVDVYDGNDMLGRTPITTKLSVGVHKLRFTDKKTGLNVYRTYKIRPAGDHHDSIAFGTSKLVVEAPDGAAILLNSRLVGKAPIEPVTIYEGKYHLKVTLDGKSWADWFDAPPGRTINYKVTLSQ